MKSLRSVALAAVLAAVPVAAGAQGATDPIARGYAQFHEGDQAGAIKHFDALLAQRPNDLAARFAQLAARYKRLQAVDEPAFSRDLDALIGLADARHIRTVQDTEATFYLAQAHMLRAEYRFDHGKGMWGAARDGAKAKGFIDDYIRRHPEHDDAYYVLGLYNYYVDIAPAFARVLRMFLFLPSGDRRNGLKQLERAAEKGSLFGPEAALVLTEAYARYENRPEDALAAQRLEVWRVDDAIAALTAVIDAKVVTPDWVLPQFLLRRANYSALIEDPQAADDVTHVLKEFKTEAWQKAALDLQKWMNDRKASGEAARFAALVPAHRLAAERKWDEARKAYLTQQQKDPQSLTIKYRLAYLDFASGKSDESMAAFSALAANKAAPLAIRANSLLYVARAHDLAGRRELALKTYNAVADTYEKTRAGQLARIGLVTPYKRPKT